MVFSGCTTMLRFASFFAGMGGFDLGFQRAGMLPVFHCEIDPHYQMVLRRHWPEVPLHDDITTLSPPSIPPADIWAAGWPCQDLSHATTERVGLKGQRSLFYQFTNLAREARPRWVVLENVIGLIGAEEGRALEGVVNTLEKIGYLGGWFACNTFDFGLPHPRGRVFVIATYRSDAAVRLVADCCLRNGNHSAREARRSDTRSNLRAVTQIAEWIGRKILAIEATNATPAKAARTR